MKREREEEISNVFPPNKKFKPSTLNNILSILTNRDITFLGWNFSPREGFRYFLLIPCQYFNLQGGVTNYLPVYVSSGANSTFARDKFCLLPFHGIFNTMKCSNDSDPKVLSTIIKANYVTMMSKFKKLEGFKGYYNNVVSHFGGTKFRDTSGTDHLLPYCSNAGMDWDSLSKIDKKHLLDKLGGYIPTRAINKVYSLINSFIDDVVHNVHNVDMDGISNWEITLDQLNEKIGCNNYYGLNLSEVQIYSSTFTEYFIQRDDASFSKFIRLYFNKGFTNDQIDEYKARYHKSYSPLQSSVIEVSKRVPVEKVLYWKLFEILTETEKMQVNPVSF
jgi:hypothetical protein